MWALSLGAGDLNTTARLVLGANVVRPGDTVWAGVHLKMQPKWHTYWLNPGESGMATAVEWELPTGVGAGALRWPLPETYESGGMTTYVYHDETVLMSPLTIGTDVAPGPLTISARVTWLECMEACVTGEAQIHAELTVGSASKASEASGWLESWLPRLPRSDPALKVVATYGAALQTNLVALLLEVTPGNGLAPADFLAYPADGFELQPAVEVRPASGGAFRLRKVLRHDAATLPAELAGVLVWARAAAAPAQGVEVVLKPRAGEGETGVGRETVPAGGLFWTMLASAFLGGLILNFMPCVLPVIALKILAFVNQSREDRAGVRRLGMVYALGVVVSFVVLALVVIGVQRAGGSASWGMQMQNPHFRLVLTIVVTLVALNLFGLFEVTLGGRALGTASQLASREGAPGAFFNGVLTVALATPCTAPFLTVALGFAFTQSAGVILLMFVTTAMGLATPYVALSWHPGWLRFVPKPGVWMQRFKVAMGFPMLATAVWLLDLTASAYGEGGGLWLGLFLVLIGLAAWVWGEFVQRGVGRRGVGMLTAVGLLGIAYGVVLEGQLHWRNAGARPVLEIGAVPTDPDAIVWQSWSAEAVDQARASGHPVLVDFTARWCLTCRSNKKLAVDIPEVRARLREIHAVALRADNTNPDPAITAELKRHQRAGVPLVLVYPADRSQPPIVLPTLLTPGVVLEALARVAPKG